MKRRRNELLGTVVRKICNRTCLKTSQAKLTSVEEVIKLDHGIKESIRFAKEKLAEPYSQTQLKEVEGEEEEAGETGKENKIELLSEYDSWGKVLQKRGAREEGTKQGQ